MTVHTCSVDPLPPYRPRIRYPALCLRHQRSLAEQGITVELMTGSIDHVCEYCAADRAAKEDSQ